MSDPYEVAVEALFGAPFSQFVDERKRLAAELKAAGAALPAKRLAAVTRPPISVWVVNQLWRHARTEMDALFAAAARMRAGDMTVAAIHREVLADLRERAIKLLAADGNAGGEPTMRRVAQTLQALAAAGSFDPDPPGQLTTDRDPPGFEALAGLVGAAPAKPAPAPSVAKPAPPPKKKKPPADETPEAAAARAEEERVRAEAEATARERATERRNLEAASRTAQRAYDVANRELATARAAMAAAQDRFDRAQAALTEASATAEAAATALDQHDQSTR